MPNHKGVGKVYANKLGQLPYLFCEICHGTIVKNYQAPFPGGRLPGAGRPKAIMIEIIAKRSESLGRDLLMARSSVVVVNILVMPNHYCRNTKCCKENGGQDPS